MAEGDSGASLGGTPHAPNIDPRSVTTAGQTLSPQQTTSPQGMNATWGPIPIMTSGMTFREVGSSGLRQFSGWVREEFLQVLTGRQAAQKYREMMDNSPTIGALLFAIQSLMRKVEWRVQPSEEKGSSQEGAEFLESCMHDQSHTWQDFVGEALSMLPFGFAPMEICYKKRLGRDPGPDPNRPGEDLPTSEYDDGKIGWRRLPLRGQDTIIKWFFDENGIMKGMTQQPWVGPLIDVPIEKMLLLRPIHYKSNPEGRALDPQTPIPTPDGWRQLDDINVGDKVFDERGRIRYVVARADWEDRPCYRVRFSDDTEIIADANHQWRTTTLYERTRTEGLGKIRTTDQIAHTVKANNTVKSSNHAVAWCEPLDYPAQLLPIDPYFLGLWLGDGTSLSSTISCHADDVAEEVALIEACGYAAEVTNNGSSANGRSIRVFGDKKWDSQGPAALLRALDLRANKHIPEAYLRGSVEQRRALLSGLMDSDGTVDTYGRCEFSNTNMGLVYGVAELVRSLGCSALVRLRKRADGIKHKQDSWCVKFRPEWAPFRLSRKAARVRGHRARDQHYVIAVESCESRRTVCIEVDSPSHMFLAGDGMIPTHNSIIRNSYVPWYYAKRMQEQEAILSERLAGIPVIYVPGQLMDAAAAGDANATAALNMYKKIAVNTRIDEQMGIVLPSETYPGANGPSAVQQYKFELITPNMRTAGLDFNTTITRYNLSIMTSVLADFLTLGHEARGTQSLAVSKIDLFFQAVEGYLNSIAAVLNRYGVPRLWKLNGWDADSKPTIEPDMAQRVDLDVLSNFILRLSQAGMPLFPNDDLQSYILDAGGLPDIQDDRALQAAGLNDDQLELEDQKAQAQLDRIQNPPQPQPGKPPAPGQTNLEKMILASAARRQVRLSGPKFGVLTKRKKSGHAHAAR